MKISILLISFFLISGAGKKDGLWQAFDKVGYYSVMASGDKAAVDSMLSILRQETFKEKEAYEGALLMRKAGLLKIPGEKLRFFRMGAHRLEMALENDSSNAEYHFLRLIIQEHAPRILHYSKDQEKDSQFIYRSFRRLSPVVQKAIEDYCKQSKVLSAKELNG